MSDTEKIRVAVALRKAGNENYTTIHSKAGEKMPLLETLIVTVGGAIGKSLLDVWLKDNPVASAAASSTIDVLKSKTSDIIAARKIEREFSGLADRIALSLEPVFRSYMSEKTPESSLESVAYEASNAISAAYISAKLLASLNNNPVTLAKHIKENHPVERGLFSEQETSLYNRTIDLSAQYLVDLVANLPDFNAKNFSEILTRLDNSMSILKKILQDMDYIRQASSLNNEVPSYANFEADYRASVVRKLDKVNLFGADVSRTVKRYQLTVAYVSLQVFSSADSDADSEDDLSVESALARTKRIAIIGEAGSGKTTLLQWLAVSAGSNNFSQKMESWNGLIPFWIELRRHTSELPVMEDFVTKVFPELVEQKPKRWVENIFKNDRALLLIDGLDEVQPSRREEVLNWLEMMLQTYPDLRVVFTSRPTAYKKGWLRALRFDEFALAAMDHPRIKMFVEHWHDAALVDQGLETEEQADVITVKLLNKLRDNAPLFKLATNPLLCAMLSALHYDRHMQLPKDRHSLYEACISGLLERRDAERDIQFNAYPELRYQEKRALLDDLAYWALKNGLASFTFDQAAQRISSRIVNMQITSDAETVLMMFIERSGIIRELSVGIFNFVHRTFQEYMAASAASSESDWGLLTKNALDDQWQETIILAAGFAKKEDANSLIGKLLDLAQEANTKYSSYLKLLAIACLETAIEVSLEIRDRVEEILVSLLPPKDEAAIKHLATAGNIVVPHLGAKDTYSLEETVACIKLLAGIATPLALTKMITYVQDDRRPVTNEIMKVLRGFSPREITASGLAEELKQLLRKSVHGKQMQLDGVLLYALSELSESDLSSEFSGHISKVEIINFKPCNLSLSKLFPNVNSFMLSGNLDIAATDLPPVLSSLDLRNRSHSQLWPQFVKSSSFLHLATLRLKANFDADSVIWPDFLDISRLSKLNHLSIFSEHSTDLPDLEDLSQLGTLQYLHLAIVGGAWPTFASLTGLEKLTEIELSSVHESSFVKIAGIEELPALKTIRINAPELSDATRYVLSDLKLLGLNVELKTGWNPRKW